MSPCEFTKILVPVDGSEGADRALECAVSICTRFGARLTALAVEGRLPAYAATVGEIEEAKREKDEFFSKVLKTATERAAEHGVELQTTVIGGHAAEVIPKFARQHDHDLIVIGYRGHFLGDFLLGSTADRVAHHASCPVLIVR